MANRDQVESQCACNLAAALPSDPHLPCETRDLCLFQMSSLADPVTNDMARGDPHREILQHVHLHETVRPQGVHGHNACSEEHLVIQIAPHHGNAVFQNLDLESVRLDHHGDRGGPSVADDPHLCENSSQYHADLFFQFLGDEILGRFRGGEGRHGAVRGSHGSCLEGRDPLCRSLDREDGPREEEEDRGLVDQTPRIHEVSWSWVVGHEGSNPTHDRDQSSEEVEGGREESGGGDGSDMGEEEGSGHVREGEGEEEEEGSDREGEGWESTVGKGEGGEGGERGCGDEEERGDDCGGGRRRGEDVGHDAQGSGGGEGASCPCRCQSPPGVPLGKGVRVYKTEIRKFEYFNHTCHLDRILGSGGTLSQHLRGLRTGQTRSLCFSPCCGHTRCGRRQRCQPHP